MGHSLQTKTKQTKTKEQQVPSRGNFTNSFTKQMYSCEIVLIAKPLEILTLYQKRSVPL